MSDGNGNGRPHRNWSIDEATAILTEYDEAPRGTKGDVLLKHGVTPGHLAHWRGRIARDRLKSTGRADFASAVFAGLRPPPSPTEWIFAGLRAGFITNATAAKLLTANDEENE